MSPGISRVAMELEEHLTRMVDSAGVIIAMLITKEGLILAEAGDTKSLNTTAAAALVAGMFSATKEVARMVGEDQFSILLQQGKNRHVHISLVNIDSMMVVVFEEYQRIGLVRHEARKTGKVVSEILKASREKQRANEEISVSQFKAYALNLVDQIFSTD